MQLHTLKFAENSRKKSKRIARGGSRGGTSGRGHNGAQSRSGYTRKSGFEGGQMPLQRRVPKFGFKNPNRVEYKAINLDILSSLAEKKEISIFDRKTLLENGLISGKTKYKILSRGDVTKKIIVHAEKISTAAKEKIEKAGGKVVLE